MFFLILGLGTRILFAMITFGFLFSKTAFSQTKILSNTAEKSSVKVDENEVQILGPEESERYLGRKLALHDYHATE